MRVCRPSPVVADAEQIYTLYREISDISQITFKFMIMLHIARRAAPCRMSRFAPIKLIPIYQEPLWASRIGLSVIWGGIDGGSINA